MSRSGKLIALALVATFAAGWTVNGWRKDAAYETERADLHQAVADAQQKAREEERRRQEEIENVRTQAQQQIDQARTDAADAGATAGQLRTQLARLRAASGHTCAAGGSPATVDAIGVLIDVLEGVESTGREIAEYADRARIAGQACERAYDSLR
jgi:hypothetical protein